MPCNSDYMDPNEKEKNSKEICQHIVYVLKSLHKRAPEWIENASKDLYGNPKRINEAIAFLCVIVGNLSEQEKNSILYDGRIKEARNLADFWEKHLEADRLRNLNEDKDEIQRQKDETEFSRLKLKLGK